jgi:hypothetical protein
MLNRIPRSSALGRGSELKWKMLQTTWLQMIALASTHWGLWSLVYILDNTRADAKVRDAMPSRGGGLREANAVGVAGVCALIWP